MGNWNLGLRSFTGGLGESPRSITLVYLPSCALRETEAGREQAAPSEQVTELGLRKPRYLVLSPELGWA